MLKFCKLNNEYIMCDDNTIAKYNLKVLYELSEENYKTYGSSFYTENGELVFGKSPAQLNEEELAQLLTWFEEYDNQVKQYQRCQRLGIEFDKDITTLDNQAKINAARITELRNLK